MKHLRLLSTVAVAGLCALAILFPLARTATAGDPDGPGSGHHGSGAQITIQPVNNNHQGEDPQDRVRVSLSGDPDNPTGKKNGSSPLILAIDRISRYFAGFSGKLHAVTERVIALR